jgi:hypothetical protein
VGLARALGRPWDSRYSSVIKAMLCAPTRSRWIHRPHSTQAQVLIEGLASLDFLPLETQVGHIVDVRYSSTNAVLYPRALLYQV